MPIYEYRCVNCDRSFEAFVRPGDGGARCPACHGSKLTREMSTFAARAGNGNAHRRSRPRWQIPAHRAAAVSQAADAAAAAAAAISLSIFPRKKVLTGPYEYSG
jgi:putative FmdB family regulatory protein